MPRGLSEFELIDSLRSRAGVSARLLEGIGDDAAVTAPDGFTVTSVDAVVEEIVEHSRQNETAREGMRAFLAQEPAVMRDPLTRFRDLEVVNPFVVEPPTAS